MNLPSARIAVPPAGAVRLQRGGRTELPAVNAGASRGTPNAKPEAPIWRTPQDPHLRVRRPGSLCPCFPGGRGGPIGPAQGRRGSMAASPIECGAALRGPSGTSFLSTRVIGPSLRVGKSGVERWWPGRHRRAPPPPHTPSLNFTFAPERFASEAGLIREARLVRCAFLGNWKARFLQREVRRSCSPEWF